MIVFCAGVDDCDEPSWMEQERRACCGTGSETLAEVHTAFCSIYQHCQIRDGSHSQDTGILLRKHEFYEDLPKNNTAIL